MYSVIYNLNQILLIQQEKNCEAPTKSNPGDMEEKQIKVAALRELTVQQQETGLESVIVCFHGLLSRYKEQSGELNLDGRGDHQKRNESKKGESWRHTILRSEICRRIFEECTLLNECPRCLWWNGQKCTDFLNPFLGIRRLREISAGCLRLLKSCPTGPTGSCPSNHSINSTQWRFWLRILVFKTTALSQLT